MISGGWDPHAGTVSLEDEKETRVLCGVRHGEKTPGGQERAPENHMCWPLVLPSSLRTVPYIVSV